MKVFIGYDEREKLAAEVCAYSLFKHLLLGEPEVYFLKKDEIPEYNRHIPGDKESTDFTYTRFLVPYLSNYEGTSIFVDCDFLFKADICELDFWMNDNSAVRVVKHPMYIPNSSVKMDGVYQHHMNKKNWASLIVFNNDHPSCKKLTPELINNYTNGRWFHQFGWCDESEIEALPLEWNCLDDYYYLEFPKAIHYTDGGPWFDEYQDTMYSEEWKFYRKEFDYAGSYQYGRVRSLSEISRT